MFKLFWYTYIHSNRVDIYVNGVTNSLHIMASIASTSISCIMQDVLAHWQLIKVFLIYAHVSSQEGRDFMHLIFILARHN